MNSLESISFRVRFPPRLNSFFIFGPAWLLFACGVGLAQPNLVLLISPAGEYVGQGQTYYTTNQADMAISGNLATVTIIGLGFTNTFAAPSSSNLTVGQYPNAVLYPTNGSAPGLSISRSARNCSYACGTYQIFEIQTNGSGQVSHFWATFSQQCNCSTSSLSGEIRYNSLLAPSAPLSRTLRVPGDFSTIQAALDTADPFAIDTVLVGPGLYAESVQFGSKAANLISISGPATTFIVAPSGQPCVSFVNPGAVLCGFTLSDSFAGVSVDGAGSPLIVSNAIVGCGTGIGSYSSSPIIRSNLIVGCSGAGIVLQALGAAVIEGNCLQSNHGGVFMDNAGSPTIRNNIVRDNIGNGIDMNSGSVPADANVSQNLILNNTGHGIYFPGGGRGPWIMNNTVDGNGGAGIVKDGSAGDVQMLNNIVVGDPALLVLNDVFPALIQFNDFYSRTGAAVTGLITNLAGVDGNISSDPLFACEPGRDFHLVAASPCIGAGTNGAALLSATDFDGNPRIVAAGTNGSAVVDLGAFEFEPTAPPSPCLFVFCPSNIAVMAAPGQDSAAATYPAPFATPEAKVVTSPPSGSVFPAGENTVTVTALYGSNVTSCAFSVLVITDGNFAGGLNAPDLPWASFGDEPWFVQGAVTHDGVAAAQSGAITNNQTSTLRTVLLGPGQLSFWWKVSSWPGWDSLDLRIDGVSQANISGATDWQLQTLYLSPGPHVVDWTLVRAESWWSGQVVGWLDQVSYPPAPTPLVLLCPSNIVVVAKPSQFSASVNFQIPVFTPGAIVSSSPPSGSDFAGGDTLVIVSALYGTNATNCSFTISVRTARDLGAALNTSNMDWTTTGDASWFMETTVTHDGVAAAQSDTLTNNQRATVQTTLTGPGILTFWWKVSSAAFHDFLSVNVNGTTQAAISGEVDWQQQTIYLGSGAQVVEWTYARDAGTSAGQDAGWLDQVSYTPGPVAPLITVQPASAAQALGLTAVFSVTADGMPPLTYQWRFNGQSIPGATNASLTITNVQASSLGSYSVLVMNQVGTAFSQSATLTLTEVESWGENSYGQTNVPPTLTNVAAIAGGWHHSVVLFRDGKLTAWGDNSKGQTNVPPGLSNVVAIASRSGDHSMALRSDGSVVVWGDNSHGQTNVPVGLSNVVAISAGGYRCLALKADGTAVSWGDSAAVPAGLSNVVAISSGDSASLFLKSDGTVASVGQAVPSGATNVVRIAGGGLHNLALRGDGTVVAWGNNSYGQTSVPTNLGPVVAIAAGDYHSLVLKADGTLAAWGSYYTGTGYIPASAPADLRNVLAIAAGSDHDLAQFGNGSPVPVLTLVQAIWTNGVFGFSVPTQNAQLYRFEFKSSLTDAAWTPLYLLSGNGNVQRFVDSKPGPAQRFYRVSRWSAAN